MYTDAHCHLAHPGWKTHLPGAIAAAKAAGVTRWISGGIEPNEWESQKKLARTYPLTLVFGLHPWWVAKSTRAEVEAGLAKLEAELSAISAVGELGLDRHFFPGEAEWTLQQFAFGAQLDLAAQYQKAIVIHAVKAHADCLKALKQKGGSWSGLIHRFQGSLPEAQAYLDLGFTLSIGGPGLEKKAKSSQALWRSIPASRLVLETDAPWEERFGVSLSGQLAALTDIAKMVAEAREEKAEMVLRQSTENLSRVFDRK